MSTQHQLIFHDDPEPRGMWKGVPSLAFERLDGYGEAMPGSLFLEVPDPEGTNGYTSFAIDPEARKATTADLRRIMRMAIERVVQRDMKALGRPYYGREDELARLLEAAAQASDVSFKLSGPGIHVGSFLVHMCTHGADYLLLYRNLDTPLRKEINRRMPWEVPA